MEEMGRWEYSGVVLEPPWLKLRRIPAVSVTVTAEFIVRHIYSQYTWCEKKDFRWRLNVTVDDRTSSLFLMFVAWIIYSHDAVLWHGVACIYRYYRRVSEFHHHAAAVAAAAPRGAGGGAVKPCAPPVPRQLSYSDVDHKRIGWLRATDYFEDVNYNVIDHAQFLVCMADIR